MFDKVDCGKSRLSRRNVTIMPHFNLIGASFKILPNSFTNQSIRTKNKNKNKTKNSTKNEYMAQRKLGGFGGI